MKKRGLFSNLFDSFLIFIFIYGLVFNGLGFATSKIALFYVVLVVNKKELIIQISKNKFLKYCLVIWILFSVYFFGVTVFSGRYHFGFLQQTFWFFWEGVLGSFIFAFYLLKRYEIKQVLYLVSLAIAIQSAFVLLSFLSGGFREFIDTILVSQERAISAVRLRGISNGGGAGLSYLQSLGVFTFGYLYLSNFRDGRSNKIIIVSILLIFVSQIFIARTGMLFSGLFIAALVFQNALNKGSLKPLIIQVFSLIFVSALVYNFYSLFIPRDKIAVFNERIVSRAFEFIDSYNETGNLKTQSTTALNNMYFLPKSEAGILLGEGIWDSNENRKETGRIVSSDVGYVRIVFAVGVIGALIFYSIYCSYINVLLKTNITTVFKLGIFALIIVFALGELKEPFLVRSSGIIKILCLCIFVFIPIKKNIIRNSL
ncbi:hypothetical protein [Pedobacter sp. V48]|uniref:hypothetical protein n=1 Tax=Pedobacter sp. V48 TaxID=509635 RepID=UPI0003E52B31|nr:hypothetical protein [Pedobacter sp. V48]ETZ24550.1 hypothetical protein N824_13610 [Pedobacter sp. V48]